MATGKIIALIAGVGLVAWGSKMLINSTKIDGSVLVGGVLLAGGIYIIKETIK